MRVTICAVGRMRPGPEKSLYDDYAQRFDRTGRVLGLGPLDCREVEAKKGGVPAEAALLDRALPDNAVIVALDERGRQIASPALADRLSGWRDEGQRELAILIGGADGLAEDLRSRAHLVLSLGQMVWPHMLVRVMLAEQLYRAATILAGTPYHRT